MSWLERARARGRAWFNGFSLDRKLGGRMLGRRALSVEPTTALRMD